MIKSKKSIFLVIVIILVLTVSIIFINNKNNKETEKIAINVGVLKGPTGIGSVKLIDDAEKNQTENIYNFNIFSSPDEIIAKIINNELDIATVPTNVAAVLYNKTNGNIKLSAINTLGVLYIVENGNEINTINDLEGKKIISSGKGSIPEYILNYILDSNNIKNVEIEYKSEHSEVVTELLNNSETIALIPEPNVTTAISNNENIRVAIDITKEWEKISENNVLAMGGLIARKDFIENNKEDFDKFLSEYKNSINFVNENIDETSILVEKNGIIPKAEIAKKSIPNCNIVYIDGEKMKNYINGFYDILYNYEPKSVGGNIPDEEFYYIPKN